MGVLPEPIEELLATGHRVLAVDPFWFGESKMDRAYLYGLLVATVGDRPLGIEAGQLAALSRWATVFSKSKPAIHTIGPRSSIVALTAAAMEPESLGELKPSQQMETLHDVIQNNWTVIENPELFCFGLLEFFDVPQLKALAAKD